jgi:hypothetical protein
LDGEPSYEGIPQGLHDPTQPLWTDADARRYAYWSVFAGACGHTYGDNAVLLDSSDNKIRKKIAGSPLQSCPISYRIWVMSGASSRRTSDIAALISPADG